MNHNQEVVGRYRSARAIESNLLKGISALSDSDTRITANNNGGITMSYPSLNVVADYVETEPYLYERISKESTPLDYAGLDISRLYFLTDANGKVLQLSYGVIADELPVTFLQTATFNYILLGVSGVLFLLGLILGGIAWRKKARQKGTGSHSSELSIYKSVVSLSFLGFLMIVNLGVTIVGLAGDPFQSMSNFNSNIVLFWIIGIAFLPAAFLAGRNLKVPMVNTVFIKKFVVILMVSFLALTFFLYSYNFFFLV